jgi:hypothetical protein
VGFGRIGGDRLKALAELIAGRFQILLVLDRVFLDVFQRYQPPLLVEAVEFGVWRFALAYCAEPRR